MKNKVAAPENDYAAFDRALHHSGREKYLLRLYVTGATSGSLRAIQNIKRICEQHLKGRYHLEVVDVYQQPTLAKGEQIVAAPTLVKCLPKPLRKFIGDMANTERILAGIGFAAGEYTQPILMQRRRDTKDAHTAELELRLSEAEETLRAIRHGEVDALVVAGSDGDQVFTLQGTETPYRFLVEEMNEGALLVARDGTILYANLKFGELAGVPLEQLVGSPWERGFAPAEHARLKALLRGSTKDGIREEFQLQNGNSSRSVKISLTPINRGGVEGFSVVITDLTERKAAEQALLVSNTKLRELVAELEQFSYSISHDMRAPLRSMKSFADLLEENSPHIDRRDLLRRISAAAGRLDALIEGTLNYARVVKEEIVVQPVELSDLISSLLETYPNFVSGTADIHVEGHLPTVLGNEAALTQVFSNLLGNAIKFVAPGVRPRVRIWAEARGERVRIWVEDNGIGIPADAQKRIFQMFHRVNKSYEGTGIGLAVVRKVVERLGGSVGVEATEGEGSRFWVDLKVPETQETPHSCEEHAGSATDRETKDDQAAHAA